MHIITVYSIKQRSLAGKLIYTTPFIMRFPGELGSSDIHHLEGGGEQFAVLGQWCSRAVPERSLEAREGRYKSAEEGG